jgi:ferredoxin-NADP reductase
MSEPLHPARVLAIRYEALDAVSIVLGDTEGKRAFPAVEPGSHIDIQLPNGMMRSYSLSNGCGDAGLYRLTIARDAASRGGSICVHDQVRAGSIVQISAPRNNFALHEAATLSVFIAGGIGVTPFVPMMARLNQLRKPWRLHYCVRTRERAALLGEIGDLAKAASGELLPNFDGEPGGAMLDLDHVLTTLPAGAHVYCCGPKPMLDAYRAGAHSGGLDPDIVHYEYFNADVTPATGTSFTLYLQKSGLEIAIPKGQTILDTLVERGIDVPYSCKEGVCGSCETAIVSGIADHRDTILSERERAENKTMMICCSGSKSERLVLDL